MPYERVYRYRRDILYPRKRRTYFEKWLVKMCHKGTYIRATVFILVRYTYAREYISYCKVYIDTVRYDNAILFVRIYGRVGVAFVRLLLPNPILCIVLYLGFVANARNHYLHVRLHLMAALQRDTRAFALWCGMSERIGTYLRVL